jgi:hypothetical protein
MFVRLIAAVGILTVGLFLSATLSSANPDYTRRTNKECEYCHPPNSRALNEAGKYYQQHKNSLAGFKPRGQAKEETARPAGDTPARKTK